MKSNVLQHSPLVYLLISIKPHLPKKMQMANVTKSMANTIASTQYKEILICSMTRAKRVAFLQLCHTFSIRKTDFKAH